LEFDSHAKGEDMDLPEPSILKNGFILEIFGSEGNAWEGIQEEWKWLIYHPDGETLLMCSTRIDSPTARGRKSQEGRQVGRYQSISTARKSGRQWYENHRDELCHEVEMGKNPTEGG